MVYHSNINYLVPVLDIRTPHKKSWLRAYGAAVGLCYTVLLWC